MQFISQNFGLIEWLLCIELVTMLAAGIFYQVAKLIARTDRHDPLVKFYRVFWQAFVSSVTPIKQLELMQAEQAARMSGMAMAGDVGRDDLAGMDAPELFGADDIEATGTRDPETRVTALAGGTDERLAPAKRLPASSTSSSKSSSSKSDNAEERAVKSTFDVLLLPLSPDDSIVGHRAGELHIRVTASPEDGQANGVIIALVSEGLKIPPYRIILISGHYKVRKRFQVAGVEQSQLNSRLAQL